MKAIILGSGSKGNSTLLLTDTKKILIDVGFSYPKTKLILEKYNYKPSDIDFILITHNHKDHIAGLASLVKREKKFVYIPKGMYQEINKIVDADYLMPITSQELVIDDLKITLLPTSHDAKASVGFLIEDTKSVVYITDTGYISKKNLEFMHNKNMYIIESNHDPKMLMDGPYPYVLKQRVIGDTGHLSNQMTGNYLKEIIGNDTKEIVLAHLSETNNTEELALKTVSDILNTNIEIQAAKQESELIVTV